GLRNRVAVALLAAWVILNLTALQNNYKIIPLIGLPLLLLLPGLPLAPQRWPRAIALLQVAVLWLACCLGLALQATVAQSSQAYPLGPSASLGERILLSSR